MDQVILSNLLKNEEYVRKTLPFLKEEYFHDQTEKLLYKKIRSFIESYNQSPSREEIIIELENDNRIAEGEFDDCVDYLKENIVESEGSIEWLLDQTEKFCKDRALHNAIVESIHIIDGENKDLDKGSIPVILQDALGVSFDHHIGHDFLTEAERRYEFYHNREARIPFDIDLLNTVTKGGAPNKCLMVLLAGTNVGKSLAMCHFAATNLMNGKNVLYITLEMAEERIAERIDANLLGIELNDLEKLSKDMYMKKVHNLQKKTPGNLIIKEYPPTTVGASNFRHLLNELHLKKKFVPDIVYVDYINLCMSSRLRGAKNFNSYTYVKFIAEELRGLAVERNFPLITASQFNREGFGDSDPGMDDVSESFGLAFTADLVFAMISSEALEDRGQIMFKQLKNRYFDVGTYRKFCVGYDKWKMRLYNCNNTDVPQKKDDEDDIPVTDRRNPPGVVSRRKLWDQQ